jgi:hypothetical protein
MGRDIMRATWLRSAVPKYVVEAGCASSRRVSYDLPPENIYYGQSDPATTTSSRSRTSGSPNVNDSNRIAHFNNRVDRWAKRAENLPKYDDQLKVGNRTCARSSPRRGVVRHSGRRPAVVSLYRRNIEIRHASLRSTTAIGYSIVNRPTRMSQRYADGTEASFAERRRSLATRAA